MGKNLIASMILTVFASTAMAAAAPTPAALTPAVQYSRDANYIIVKQPLRVTLDAEQQATLRESVAVMSEQLGKFDSVRGQDPNGDLKGLSDSLKNFNSRLDQLVDYAGLAYGDVAPIGLQLFQTVPTAVIVFAGFNADKNILRFLNIGGSGTVAFVFVPMRVQRINVRTKEVLKPTIEWDSATVLITLGLAAAQVAPSALPGLGSDPAAVAAQQQASGGGRVGFGFVWGELNKASELVGAVGGGTITVNMVVGVNAKILAVKNVSKPGAVNNYILMLGVQRQADLKNKIPWTDIKAEFGVNGGAIVDAPGLLSGSGKFLSDVGSVITGNKKKDADQ
ncbi:MAG: hypothetical protein ACXVA9_03995 [Bdellovibrionales bacterium]